MSKYPKINYIGNKDKLVDWIIDNLPLKKGTVLDLFSGGNSVAYALKENNYFWAGRSAGQLSDIFNDFYLRLEALKYAKISLDYFRKTERYFKVFPMCGLKKKIPLEICTNEKRKNVKNKQKSLKCVVSKKMPCLLTRITVYLMCEIVIE